MLWNVLSYNEESLIQRHGKCYHMTYTEDGGNLDQGEFDSMLWRVSSYTNESLNVD